MHPDLTKLVSLSVKPLEKAEDAVTGGETLTVDTTAGDATGVQDPTTEGGTVETVQTEEPTVEVQDPATEGGTVETVKTEKPKLNEKKVNPLADLKGDPVLPETTITDIIERAEMSYRAFYERFESKEDAIVAALDVGSLQMLATE